MIRIATYNIHKCRGMDRRVSPARIADVLSELDSDVIAVQEVLGPGDNGSAVDQAAFLAERLGCSFVFGETRKHEGAAYGNATLSRLPITFTANYDITWKSRERRGCLRADIQVSQDATLHVFNVHLGTSLFERPHQAKRLLSDEILNRQGHTGPRVVMGDFNEWTRGVATRLMGSHLESVDMKLLGRRRTYPGLLPVLHLDHFYYDRTLALKSFRLHRSRAALVASDHLPLVADFALP